jgi:hypothetical protein
MIALQKWGVQSDNPQKNQIKPEQGGFYAIQQQLIPPAGAIVKIRRA